MSYQVLARKYRPKNFETLVGQEHVVRALTHALRTERLHHAYLFTGTRGVGKTTLSRILAKSLNCTGPDGQGGITAEPCGQCEACRAIDAGRFVDYIEMDAASNRGVDEMAQLLEQAVYAPSNARFKVYMIDEVHMLTNHAFNAMLKTLEEPPPHVKFILATTDPQKIPVTVLSRCLQFNLKQMPPGHIVGHLENILGQEGVSFEQPALRLLAQGAHGSMRDALSLTDQAIAYAAGQVTLDAVQGMLGALDQSYLVRLLDAQLYVSFLRQVTMAVVWGLRLLATYIWISFLLGEFAYTRSWGEWLKGYLVELAVGIGQSMAAAIPGLLVVLVIAALARLVMLTAASVFKRVESGELQVGWLDQDTAAPTRRLVNIVIALFALAMSYPYLPGSHTAAFQGVTVLAGLMVSIGASSIVAQGAAGLILMYTRSLRKGEYVRVGDKEGTVVDMGMFETRLRTGSGEEVLMPNAWVLSNTTSNFSRDGVIEDGFVTEVKVTLAYETPWRTAHALLEQAAAATPGIAADPKPFIVQAALSDFYVEYRLCAHSTVDSPRGRAEVRNHLHQNVLDVFDAAGVGLTSSHFHRVTLTEKRA